MAIDKITLKRSSSFFRPLYYHNLEVEQLIFYSKGKIVYSSRSAWLECEERRQDITSITITEPKRALKVDLNRKDNFYIKGSRDYKFKNGFIFYINIDLENITFEKPFIIDYYEDENEINKKELMKINFKNMVIYESYLDENKELMRREIKTDYAILYLDTITIRKEQGLKADNLKILFDEAGFKDVSKYDIERALNKYNITITPK